MRFDSARVAGLDEAKAALVEDGYEAQLSPKESAVLQLTDALLGMPQVPEPSQQAQILEHLSPDEVMELLLGIGLFHGMSKVLINLGLEPHEMPVTVMPTPGS